MNPSKRRLKYGVVKFSYPAAKRKLYAISNHNSTINYETLRLWRTQIRRKQRPKMILRVARTMVSLRPLISPQSIEFNTQLVAYISEMASTSTTFSRNPNPQVLGGGGAPSITRFGKNGVLDEEEKFKKKQAVTRHTIFQATQRNRRQDQAATARGNGRRKKPHQQTNNNSSRHATWPVDDQDLMRFRLRSRNPSPHHRRPQTRCC